jgi:hypothetical protein
MPAIRGAASYASPLSNHEERGGGMCFIHGELPRETRQPLQELLLARSLSDSINFLKKIKNLKKVRKTSKKLKKLKNPKPQELNKLSSTSKVGWNSVTNSKY